MKKHLRKPAKTPQELRVCGTSTKIYSLNSQFNQTKTSLQKSVAKNRGLLLPPSATSQWAGFPQRAQHQHFPSWPTAAKVKLQASTAEKLGDIPSYA